jgi:hypothetical protein
MLKTLLILSQFGHAFAGSFSVQGDNLPPRSYKFEVYHYAPVGTDPSSSDWRPIDAEIWSGILDCKRTAPWTDVCRFRDQRVVYTFHMDGDADLERHPLRFPGEIELVFTPDGRTKRWDIRGQMEDFWHDASMAWVASFRDPKGRYYSPNDERRIGQNMEELLAHRIRGAFELPLASSSPGGTSWKLRKNLWVTRVLSDSITSLTGTGAVMATKDNIATIGFEARIKESRPDVTISGQLSGRAQIDTVSSALLQNTVTVTYAIQYQGEHTRRVSLLETAKDGMTPFPGELAGNPLE